MHNVTERVFIFSVYNSKRNGAENAEKHKEYLELLKSRGYAPTTVDGRYNEVDEQSILLYGTNLTEPVVEEITKAELQDSYLVIYHDGVAELVFNTGARKIIGEFRETTEDKAKASDAYSKVGNQYFIVE